MNSKVSLLVLSRVVERDAGAEKLVGYLVLMNGVQPNTLPRTALAGVSRQYPFSNAIYKPDFDILEGTHGAPLTAYPAITKECVLCSANGIIVYSLVKDAVTGKIIGVVAFNGIGQSFRLSLSAFLNLTTRFANCNFNMKDRDGVVVPVMKDGTEFPVITMKAPSTNPVKQLHTGNKVIQEESSDIPQLVITTLIDDSVRQYDVSAQQKLTQAMLDMKYLTPYYHCCISAIKRMPAPGSGTFGVTEDTLYYDMKFAAELAIEELIFVMIHEMMHIAMQHSVRFGKTRTSHKLWNIACDLYINSIICENFGIHFGGPPATINVKVSPNSTSTRQVSIKTPEFGVFMETIGEKIDLAKDTPETIYDKLVKENPQQAQGGGGSGNLPSPPQQGKGKGKGKNKSQDQGQNQGQGGSDPSQGQGQSSGGSGSSQSQGGSDPSQGQGQSSGGGSSQGQGRDSGDDLSSGGQGGMEDVTDQLNNNKTSGQTGMDNLTEGNEAHGTELVETSVVYNGKKLSGKVAMDVMSNNNNKTAESVEASRSQSRQALQRIATKVKLTEQEQGAPLEKSAGMAGGIVTRYIEVGLSEGIRWQELLKSLLKDKPKKTFTLASPNQDYMNLGMTLADRRAIGKPTHLAGVIFAMDVSGSVSDKELNYSLSEIANIFRFYKVDAELIYWSTMVGAAGMFSSLKDLLKIDPVSTGGTDVRCVFDYVTGKTRVNGKAEPFKLKDIKAIFILTDGCFSMNFADYANIGRKIVWLVTSNPITFNPPFGRVIGFKLP